LISLKDALTSDPSDIMLSLFSVWSEGRPVDLAPPESRTPPTKVTFFHLEHPDQAQIALNFWETDLVFNKYPRGVDRIIRSWLQAYIAAGADVCWFAFEGYFCFDDTLTPEIGNYVYAVATKDFSRLATGRRDRQKPEWQDALSEARQAITF
jgi:hypothetical protein